MEYIYSECWSIIGGIVFQSCHFESFLLDSVIKLTASQTSNITKYTYTNNDFIVQRTNQTADPHWIPIRVMNNKGFLHRIFLQLFTYCEAIIGACPINLKYSCSIGLNFFRLCYLTSNRKFLFEAQKCLRLPTGTCKFTARCQIFQVKKTTQTNFHHELSSAG